MPPPLLLLLGLVALPQSCYAQSCGYACSGTSSTCNWMDSCMWCTSQWDTYRNNYGNWRASCSGSMHTSALACQQAAGCAPVLPPPPPPPPSPVRPPPPPSTSSPSTPPPSDSEEPVDCEGKVCLVLSGGDAVVLALVISLGVGVVAFCITEHNPDKGSKQFLMLEFLDLMTDVAGYWLTMKEGDLAFANDPQGWVSLALAVSVVLSAVAFFSEVAYRFNTSAFYFRSRMPLMKSLHFAFEDSFQTLLYAMVASAQASQEGGASGAALFAVLQALGFVLAKFVDTLPPQGDRHSKACGAGACACAVIAVVGVVLIVAGMDSDENMDELTFERAFALTGATDSYYNGRYVEDAAHLCNGKPIYFHRSGFGATNGCWLMQPPGVEVWVVKVGGYSPECETANNIHPSGSCPDSPADQGCLGTWREWPDDGSDWQDAPGITVTACDDTDSCCGVVCNDHSTCGAGTCSCTDGYEGSYCTMAPAYQLSGFTVDTDYNGRYGKLTERCNGKPVYELDGAGGQAVLYQPTGHSYWVVNSRENGAGTCANRGWIDSGDPDPGCSASPDGRGCVGNWRGWTGSQTVVMPGISVTATV